MFHGNFRSEIQLESLLIQCCLKIDDYNLPGVFGPVRQQYFMCDGKYTIMLER